MVSSQHFRDRLRLARNDLDLMLLALHRAQQNRLLARDPSEILDADMAVQNAEASVR
jgi:hypothetical protein